jgi:regulatory protein
MMSLDNLMSRKAYDAAIGLLARREHSFFELKKKLKLKGYDEASIEEALLRCKTMGLQCDKRYVEMLQRTRFSQGYGERRLYQDLVQAGIEPNLIDEALFFHRAQSQALIETVWNKKYKGVKPLTYEVVQKQKKFLHYRGFSHEMIQQFFDIITKSR